MTESKENEKKFEPPEGGVRERTTDAVETPEHDGGLREKNPWRRESKRGEGKQQAGEEEEEERRGGMPQRQKSEGEQDATPGEHVQEILPAYQEKENHSTHP